jgi:hypothetical protein
VGRGDVVQTEDPTRPALSHGSVVVTGIGNVLGSKAYSA